MSYLLPSASSSASTLPNYYSTLHVSQDANFNDILKSYQKLALQLHPELHPNDQATETAYEELNQAYFVLSDKERRLKYDRTRQKPSSSASNSVALTSVFFPGASEHMDFFDSVFADLIENEIKEEHQKSISTQGSLWKSLGTMSGSILGFIFANIPGAMIGAVVGFKAGQVRDKTGRSVMDVWRSMNPDKRRSILNRLVQKLLF
ncbi:hypothetical protein HMI54_015087 [Coelomomyces lativittatus]|nr:hypothetical protein HMI56_004131 [Coelomomyces lativittatus]KAJ1513344.1 hypothetical protein HMI54_015087 [Coelomomyces lativittatus]KAJ1513519.1 hypothetical protein HMI55_005499 [Coelomomyces lativittatus]